LWKGENDPEGNPASLFCKPGRQNVAAWWVSSLKGDLFGMTFRELKKAIKAGEDLCPFSVKERFIFQWALLRCHAGIKEIRALSPESYSIAKERCL
jgi:hypothetical protein